MNKLFTRKIISLLLVTSCAFGCSSECWSKPGSKEYAAVEKWLSFTPNEVPLRRFSEFTVEQQIDVVLYARSCRDDARVRPLLIAGGERNISAIIGRLRKEEMIWDKIELMLVIIGIDTSCHCVATNPELMVLIDQVAEETERSLSRSPNPVYERTLLHLVDVLKRPDS